jgi:hypothetical protein
MPDTFGPATLAALNAEREMRIRTDDGRKRGTVIWVVVVQGHVYARSVQGEQGKWYQSTVRDGRAVLQASGRNIPTAVHRVTDPGVIEAISSAYLTKYADSEYAQAMVRPEVLGTTVRLDPE